MGGAVQHPFMLPVPDGLHGLRGMETGVLCRWSGSVLVYHG